MSTHVTYKGPLFDGRAKAEMKRGLDEIEQVVADEVIDLVRSELHTVLQHPTGSYVRHLDVIQRGDAYVATDSGVVYGPWLEGVSSRNARSRFKGYSHWRRIRQRVAARADEIAERVLPKHIERMN